MGKIAALVFRCAVIIMFFTAFGKDACAESTVILAFGDSLTAGKGLPEDQAFPTRLEAALKKEGHDVKVVNAGVSGDTTSGGLTRLEWNLAQANPDYVIVELGANDMLRGIDPKITRDNLKKILDILKSHHTPVLLAGMKSFRNLGSLFGDSYQRMYKDLAKEYDAVYYPFFLDGVALDANLNQEDGLHPNAAGVDAIVDSILPSVEDLLEKEKE